MDLSKIGGIIGAVAPTIATALGGPLAGMAVKFVSNALFGHQDGSMDDIQAALLNPTADQLSALKKIDADFKIQMKSLDIDLEKIAAGDRDSARQMQIATKSWLPEVLAILATIGFFGTIAYIIRYGLPDSGKEALLLLLGQLGAAWGAVIAFYFGSSAGSQKKTEALTAAIGNGK